MEAQIEEAIKFRKKANFKILTRLSQIIDQYPYLRFHQILIIYKISELGVDKFNEESVETLKKLEHEMVEKGISKITSNSSDGTTRTWTHLYVTIPNNFKFNKRVHGFDSAAGYRGDVRARAGGI